MSGDGWHNYLELSAVAGMAGGVVAWLTRRDHWQVGIANIVVGGITAHYLSPSALKIIGAVGFTEFSPSVAGFMIGVGGMGVSGALITYWERKLHYDKSQAEGNKALDNFKSESGSEMPEDGQATKPKAKRRARKKPA